MIYQGNFDHFMRENSNDITLLHFSTFRNFRELTFIALTRLAILFVWRVKIGKSESILSSKRHPPSNLQGPYEINMMKNLFYPPWWVKWFFFWLGTYVNPWRLWCRRRQDAAILHCHNLKNKKIMKIWNWSKFFLNFSRHFQFNRHYEEF